MRTRPCSTAISADPLSPRWNIIWPRRTRRSEAKFRMPSSSVGCMASNSGLTIRAARFASRSSLATAVSRFVAPPRGWFRDRRFPGAVCPPGRPYDILIASARTLLRACRRRRRSAETCPRRKQCRLRHLRRLWNRSPGSLSAAGFAARISHSSRSSRGLDLLFRRHSERFDLKTHFSQPAGEIQAVIPHMVVRAEMRPPPLGGLRNAGVLVGGLERVALIGTVSSASPPGRSSRNSSRIARAVVRECAPARGWPAPIS